MRLSASSLGSLAFAFGGAYASDKPTAIALTSTSLGGIPVTTSPSPESAPGPIVFGELRGTKNAIPIVAAEQPNQSLGWSSSPAVAVQLVELKNKVSGAVFARWDVNSVKGGGRVEARGLSIRQSDIVQPLTLNDAHDNILFNITSSWLPNFETPVYANVTWKNNTHAGFQTSSEFAIAKSIDLIDEAIKNSGINIFNPTAGTSGQWTIPGMTTPPAQGSPTVGSEPAPATPGQSAGLSGGAIAGIAIGAVAGLALIGGLVWFFCFRRRKQQNQSRELGYGNDAGAAAMIADKEQPGVSESSPHSAYGDDGGRLHDRGSAVVDSSYMPYSDHAPQAHDQPPAAHAAPTGHGSIRPQTTGGTMSTSQEASTRYAHLVEEGMTPEEIRRLEEEERALDQAIDAAGHNRGGAH